MHKQSIHHFKKGYDLVLTKPALPSTLDHHEQQESMMVPGCAAKVSFDKWGPDALCTNIQGRTQGPYGGSICKAVRFDA